VPPLDARSSYGALCIGTGRPASLQPAGTTGCAPLPAALPSPTRQHSHGVSSQGYSSGFGAWADANAACLCAVGGAGRIRRWTLTRASSNPDEDRASGAARAAKSDPPPQPSPLPAEATSDKFLLPVVVVLAYAGLFSAFALAIDWGYILSEVLGFGGGYTADDLDTAAMWQSIK
jgi:hypothetical protein